MFAPHHIRPSLCGGGRIPNNAYSLWGRTGSGMGTIRRSWWHISRCAIISIKDSDAVVEPYDDCLYRAFCFVERILDNVNITICDLPLCGLKMPGEYTYWLFELHLIGYWGIGMDEPESELELERNMYRLFSGSWVISSNIPFFFSGITNEGIWKQYPFAAESIKQLIFSVGRTKKPTKRIHATLKQPFDMYISPMK